MIAHQRAATSTSWTPERMEKLRELHAQGLSAAQMAKALGGVSRNSVIGKCSRMRLGPIGGVKAPPPARYCPPAKPRSPKGVMVLARQGGPTQRNPAENKRANIKANAEVRETPAANVLARARAFLPLDGCVPVQFGAHGCRWPVGGEGADMLQCGAKRADGKSYCAEHSAVADVLPPPGYRTGAQLARSLRRWAA
ncbi:GcrA family cell cycle regulator [Phenylobacterium kunshanense]|uniref:GcrA cell cycle regulator n=1 Tax=Phenylobacterium kunshanense TaxID=1445034 RepID=A0A328BQL2_9CAUL|nr:GcrA family cell cycle regulator [Phenylobacterium kunshanense]RAK68791.1 hypothetical protein DJ019_01910 [Phenylobacterium kunshanense]